MAASIPPVSASFPRGLRVLVVDDEPSRSSVHHQLQPLGYVVTSCNSASEALSYCQTGMSAFDVVLAESSIVASDEISGRLFVSSMDSTPVILMSEGATTDDVMRAVQLGAVDYLDKPLSTLKLKNIWQHSVRKMMLHQSTANVNATTCYDDCRDLSFGAVTAANSKRPSFDSPGTPSHHNATEAFSAGSIPTAATTTTATVTDISASVCDVDISMTDVESQALAAFNKNTTTANVESHQWGYPNIMQPGVVRGTPIIAMPPTSGYHHQQDPLLRTSKSVSTLLAPSPSPASLAPPQQQEAAVGAIASATYDQPLIPEGFLSVDAARKERGGPLGLKLDVSNSLLTRINGVLASSS
jgi:CheY-like chemotaxis protein